MARAEEQLTQVLTEHGAALRRLARAYASDPGDADDLFQEIGFAIWRALPFFRGDCSLRTFAFRIGHNRGLSHRWRNRRRHAADDGQTEQLVDQRPTPDVVVTEDQRREVLFEAVRRLPDLPRQVVLLSLEGLGNQEIAQVLGITENNVAVRLVRARKALRAILETMGGCP
jgi:RNA polymerase sigma-70 factor (ECF subfamily)